MRAACCAIALVILLPGASWAGANANARAWLSWDRSGLVTDLTEVTFAHRDVYVHIDGAPDIQALAVNLMLAVDGDPTAALASAAPDSQSGWAEHSTAASSFYGDPNYDWIISFPQEERTKVKYSIQSSGPADTLRGSVWASSVLVQDSQGHIDTLLVGAPARLLGRSAQPFSLPTDSLPGLVIVEFEPGTIASGHQHIFQQDVLETALRNGLAAVSGFSVGKRVFPLAVEGETVRVSASGDTVTCQDLSRFYVLKVDDYVSVASHLEQIGALPGVIHVNPVSALLAHRTPNDPMYGQQWHLALSGEAAIGAPLAWDTSIGASSLLTCIIDSGIDYYHTGEFGPFNNSRIIRGRDFGDDDFDVYDNTPANDRGHGTSVAGIVGALTDNNFQVSGIMWTGRMLIHKTADTYGIFSYHPSYAVAAAIDDAVRTGAQTINMSLGYPISAPSGQDILFKAWWDLAHGDPIAVASYTAYRLGVTLVASAGQSDTGGGHNWVDQPGAFPWVMCAGASNIFGDRSESSHYGSAMDVLAPGVGIRTTAMIDQGGGIDPNFGGTSASAAMVSGAASLVLGESLNRSLGMSNDDVMELLRRSSRDITEFGQGHDEFTGWGHLDVGRAIARLRPPYRLARASVQGGTVTEIEGLHDHTFIGNGGLPGGRYWAKTYEIRTHVTHCAPHVEAPLMWGRERDSRGWSAANANGELPYARVENVTATGFDAVTCVYWIQYDIQGATHYQGWWPCPPDQAIAAYSGSTRPAALAALTGLQTTGSTCVSTTAAWAVGCNSESYDVEWSKSATFATIAGSALAVTTTSTVISKAPLGIP